MYRHKHARTRARIYFFLCRQKAQLAHLHTELIKIHSVLHAPTPMSCLFLWIRRNKERNTFMIAVCLFIPNIARVMFLILKGRQSRWSIYYINVAVTFSFFTENKTTKKGLKKKRNASLKWQNCFSGEHLLRKKPQKKGEKAVTRLM